MVTWRAKRKAALIALGWEKLLRAKVAS